MRKKYNGGKVKLYASDAAALLKDRLETAQTEKLYLVCIDSSGKVTDPLLIAEGGETAVEANARAVAAAARERGARFAVIAHSHPHGPATPSIKDVCFTKRLAALMAAAGITLADHIIFAKDGCFSFAESRMYRGALDRRTLR